MARPRIRSLACSSASIGISPFEGQADTSSEGFASPPNGDTSEWWGQIRWSWIHKALHRMGCHVAHEDWQDCKHTMAVHVVEELARGTAERVAYARATNRTWWGRRDNRFAGMTGDQKVMCAFGITRERLPDNLLVEYQRWQRRLTRGDWRALHTFLLRVLPDAHGQFVSKRREVLMRSLKGQCLAQICEDLQLSPTVVGQYRSVALRRCLNTLRGAYHV